jgi:hypothetical protein
VSATVLQLGAGDGLLEAAARVRLADGGGDLVLAVPEGAPVLANPLFLATLREVADRRPLVLVTSDLRARVMASGVRVAAYASLEAYEQRSADATEELERARVEAIAEIGRERRRQRALRRRAAVVVAIGLALLLALVPSAQVIVAGSEVEVGPVALAISAKPGGAIGATRFATRLEVPLEAKTGGTRTVKVRATGTERFINASTDRIDIPAGTLVWTDGRVMFRTTAARTLSASTLFPFFVSDVLVPIEAVEEGAGGNVPRGAISNVGDRRRVLVTNDQATTGGEERTVPVVTQADYAAASAQLDRAIDTAVRRQLDAWSGSVGEGERLEERYAARTLARTAAADVVDKEVDAFKLSATVELTAFAIAAAEPRAAIVRELSRLVPAEHELVPDSIRWEVGETSVGTEGVTWRVTASARHRPRLDEGALQLVLAGADRSSAASLLAPRGMKLVELRASPPWWPRLPLLPLRIHVRSDAGSALGS